MLEVAPIFKITSTYCLESILSYIEYKTVLKLVKYNKCLQKKLDISIKDYTLDYEIKGIKRKTTNYSNIYKSSEVIYAILTVSLHVYEFTYAIDYLLEKPYENKNRMERIEEYFQESFGKIKIYRKIKSLEIYILILKILFFFFFSPCNSWRFINFYFF